MRRMRRMIVLLVVLVLFVSAAAVVAATDITVDGNGSEWAWSNYQGSDTLEPEVPDQYDMIPVYATVDVDDGEYCIRFDTAANMMVNYGSYVQVFYDTNDDPGSGISEKCQTGFGNIGAERVVHWQMRNDADCTIMDDAWNKISADCNGEPDGSRGGTGTTCIEMCADAGDLGIQADQLPTVKIFVENGDSSAYQDDIFCYTQTPEDGGGQGCTPGYWKQKQHFDSWVNPPYDPYDPEGWFAEAFELDCTGWACEGKTLLQALGTGGGGEKALMRHAVAALLDAASGGVSYEYNVIQIKAMVQHAYATGDFEGIKNLFEYENELGCPLN